MFNSIKKLLFTCNKKLRKKIYFIIFMLFNSALLEFLNIILIASLLLLITDPKKIEVLVENFSYLGPLNFKIFTKIISVMVIFTAIFSGFIRTYCVNKIANLSAEIGSFLNVRLFRNILYQDVLHFYTIDKNKVFNSINNTNVAINTIIQPFFMIIMGSFSFILIALGTLAFAPLVTISILSLIIILYFLLTLSTKKRLTKLSNEQNILNKEELTLTKDSLELFKEIKLKNNQEYFLTLFERIDKQLRNKIAKVISISLTPRFVFESVGISLIGFSAFIAIIANKEEYLLPTLGLILLAMQRLIPAAQQIYSSYTNAKGSIFALNNLLNPDFININDKNTKKISQISNLKFKKKIFKSIQLKDVNVTYDNKSINILKGINLKINKGDKVGIIGQTGSGKSSLIDLLMTLIKPAEGEVLINEKVLDYGNFAEIISIRNLISYVPQTVYLKNTSIKENITFNTDKKLGIKEEKLKLACKISCVNNFSNSLRNGLEHRVGDNGVFLSGGQKQRIAIARSIYKGNKILVLDEATSGLDQDTESLVLNNITTKLKDETIILITHRPASLINFNKIIILNKGGIEEIGSFDSLQKSSTKFKKLINKNTT